MILLLAIAARGMFAVYTIEYAHSTQSSHPQAIAGSPIPQEQNCLQGFYYANGYCESQASGTGGGNLHGVMRM